MNTIFWHYDDNLSWINLLYVVFEWPVVFKFVKSVVEVTNVEIFSTCKIQTADLYVTSGRLTIRRWSIRSFDSGENKIKNQSFSWSTYCRVSQEILINQTLSGINSNKMSITALDSCRHFITNPVFSRMFKHHHQSYFITLWICQSNAYWIPRYVTQWYFWRPRLRMIDRRTLSFVL